MRKMLKDQTYAQKGRVSDAAQRRMGTQRKRTERRAERRVRRYKKSKFYQDLVRVQRMDWAKLTRLITRMGEQIRDGIQKKMNLAFFNTGRYQGKTAAAELQKKLGGRIERVAFDEVAGSKTAAALENWAALHVNKPDGFRFGNIE